MTRPAFERHLVEAHGIELHMAPPAGLQTSDGHGPYVVTWTDLSGQFGTRIDVSDSGAGRQGVALGGAAERRKDPVAWLSSQPHRYAADGGNRWSRCWPGFLLAVLAAWWLARRIVAPLEDSTRRPSSLGAVKRLQRSRRQDRANLQRSRIA